MYLNFFFPFNTRCNCCNCRFNVLSYFEQALVLSFSTVSCKNRIKFGWDSFKVIFFNVMVKMFHCLHLST